MRSTPTCMMLTFLALPALLAMPALLSAQSYRGSVNEGNELYHQKRYDDARQKYEAASVGEPERPESYFNAGNAAYRTNDVEAALKQYEQAGTRFRDRERIARTLYNAGNTFLNAAEQGAENPVLQQAAGEQAGDLRKEGYRQAIEMYKKALKLDPTDADARYNLTYARKKLEELEQQQKNQDKNQDQKQQQQKQDKQQDQKNQDKNKQEQQQKQDKQDQQQQQQKNQKGDEQEKAKPDQQQQPERKEQQMSKQQAEQILRALQREEKDLQKKKRQQQGRRVNVEKDW